ncbi:MAG: N-6 DNA methylase [Gloeobacteraceae cyanobacterium ES-bin-144]|nr:N-6 DNA methylase [Verrucomicrobiales bacterium]
MSLSAFQLLPEPPSGFRYYRSAKEILRAKDLLAYQHLLLRAWEEMGLSAVLTLNGVPTVYVHDSKRLIEAATVAELQCNFWNQGLATVLLLREPGRLRVFSSMEKPLRPDTATQKDIDASMVESINLATQAAWAEKFYLELGTGHYYSKSSHLSKFDPKETVDAYLIDNLEAVRDVLTSGPDALPAAIAHAFLGRVLFTCYLCHRGIIKLENYLGGGPWRDLRDLLERNQTEKILPRLYSKLFPELKKRFNGSMFDEDLIGEQAAIKPCHLEAIRHFLEGSEVKKGQRSLGFWAYRFDFIPVETISSIYEKFLGHEDDGGKRKLGAYYTPRLLAEMTLDLALRDREDISGLRFIDPSCGSGIFLVLAFNRLVARWNSDQRKKPSVEDRADALLAIFGQLRGVDMNLTACRIACFSLYLAFLDQFDPADVEEYIETTGHKLPNLLVAEQHGFKKATIPVIWKRDFFDIANEWHGQFDVVVGNPPWGGRGSGQIANDFMEKAPALLTNDGRAALVLPSKIFLNKTDELQRRWLSRITLHTMVQLADYSFILFKEAKCPACIVSFTPQPPAPDHEIEYIAPKVSLVDLRDGLIPVSPQDRKWIRLSELLDKDRQDPMGVTWKTRLWGTPRDQRLLDYLFTLPRLSELVGTPTQMKNGTKRWAKGQGFQPLSENDLPSAAKPANWISKQKFVTPNTLGDLFYLPESLSLDLEDYFKKKNINIRDVRRLPDERIFQPPMVLLNQGFSKAAFIDYPVRFQDSIQSFVAANEDTDYLKLLALCFRSKLFRYFAFHTSANLGTERDKVHLEEVLRLPFFMENEEAAPKRAGKILREIVSMANQHQKRCQASAEKVRSRLNKPGAGLGPLFGDDTSSLIEQWISKTEKESRELRAKVDPLIYEYYGLTAQDIALVEDTCEIFDKGDTPPSLDSARSIPTLAPLLGAAALEPYAEMISKTLNGWASGPLRVTATGALDAKTGYALVELQQSKLEKPFQINRSSTRILEAARRLQNASVEKLGNTVCFLRSGWYFDGKRILIVKPAVKGEWTRTAALNDAAGLFAHISETRHSKHT